MRRREFIAALGGAAAWPIAARAQQLETPTVGCLINGSRRDTESLIAPFHNGLRDLGYIEGQNVAIEYRWAEGHYERLSALAAELIDLRVAVIAALNGASSALAAKAVTNSIPIVFQTGGDAAELELCRKSEPAGRQPHRRKRHHERSRRSAMRSIARIVPESEIFRAPDKSSKPKRQEVSKRNPSSPCHCRTICGA